MRALAGTQRLDGVAMEQAGQFDAMFEVIGRPEFLQAAQEMEQYLVDVCGFPPDF